MGDDAPLRFRRRAFLWCEPAHPLLQRRLPAPPGCAALFRSPVAGPLHALVAEHVVRGRVLFPGAAYLETARAACSAVAPPSAAGAALRGVLFLQPLALEAGGAAWVECALLDDGAFEVRSGGGEAVEVVHCSGQWASGDVMAWRPFGLTAAQERCFNTVDVTALYTALNAVGVQLGSAWLSLDAVWEGGGEATARLRLRRRATLAGTQVHPADIDGAFSTASLLTRGGEDEALYGHTETRVPFAVGRVLMRGPAAGVLWAVASTSRSLTSNLVLGSDGGMTLAQFDGFQTRALRVDGWQQNTADKVTRRPTEHAPPFALPSARLTGVLDAEKVASLVADLPTDAACLVELRSAHIVDATPALVAFARGRTAPLLVLCSGEARGAGTLLLIDAATVAIGARGTSIAATDRCHLPRRLPCSTAAGTAADAWLDYMGTAAAARAEAQRLCTRLAGLSPALLARCHTELPAATTDGALVVMGSLWPRAPRKAGPRLVRVWVDEPHGVAIIELHDPRLVYIRSKPW